MPLPRSFASPSSSCGVDGLTSRLIKTAGPSIMPHIHHVLNLCITQRCFPDRWKIGCVTPLFKEGDRFDASNYRPISILPSMGKVFERVMHTQLSNNCERESIISKCQSGFRKGHSMTTCLLDFLDNIFVQVDQGMCCGVLFLDL